MIQIIVVTDTKVRPSLKDITFSEGYSCLFWKWICMYIKIGTNKCKCYVCKTIFYFLRTDAYGKSEIIMTEKQAKRGDVKRR